MIPDEFSFDAFETALMGSLKYQLLLEDILKTSNEDKKGKKRDWRYQWVSHYNNLLKSSEGHSSYTVKTTFQELRADLDKFRENQLFFTKSRIMILELISFIPYTPFPDSTQAQKDRWKGLKVNKSDWESELCDIGTMLGLGAEKTLHYKKCLKSAFENIYNASGNKQKSLMLALGGAAAIAVTGGFAATAIAPIFAAAGLSGAAAVSSGLAALGGGALAAGGFGMAGGFTVIVGGGAILGGASGLGIASLIQNPEVVLYECAKIQVISINIFIKEQAKINQAKEIVNSLKQSIREFEDQADTEVSKEKVKNLQKLIKYYQKTKDNILQHIKSN
ncbi:MAG: hypothetical protein GVY04_12265 [Cyanobacteria bacterium]|jgi:hypothetical protein|nr:hypothetical protein [Cyanobacteria bacterium GSL.Bin1]